MVDKYAQAPLYMVGDPFSCHYAAKDMDVLAIPFDDDIHTIDLSQARELGLRVPAGHWCLNSIHNPSQQSVVTDVAFRASFLPVEGDANTYVERGHRERALYSKGRIIVEKAFESVSGSPYFHAAARLADDGRILTHASFPLSDQARALVAAGEAGAKHLAQVREIRETLRHRFDLPSPVQQDLLMFDVIVSGRRDSVSDEMASKMSGAMPKGVEIDSEHDGFKMYRLREDSLIGIICGATGISPGFFRELRHTPLYTNEATRAFGRELLGAMIGDYPMEDVVSTIFPSQMSGASNNPVEAWAERSGTLVETLPGVNGLPGMETYVTTDYRIYSVDGVRIAFFEDPQGGYAYAWPEPPAPDFHP